MNSDPDGAGRQRQWGHNTRLARVPPQGPQEARGSREAHLLCLIASRLAGREGDGDHPTALTQELQQEGSSRQGRRPRRRARRQRHPSGLSDKPLTATDSRKPLGPQAWELRSAKHEPATWALGGASVPAAIHVLCWKRREPGSENSRMALPPPQESWSPGAEACHSIQTRNRETRVAEFPLWFSSNEANAYP